MNERWGMHFDAAVLKLISNRSVFGKKKMQFSGLLFFFIDPVKRVHLRVFWPLMQYSYEARFMKLTYLCIHCSQSFTFEHYFVGSLFKRHIDRKATKGIFKALYGQYQILLNISVLFFIDPCKRET